MYRAVAALRDNRGATLVIGLLTLVLLTLIGIAATSTSQLEVQISGNDRVFKEAFYATEFGVTRGEMALEALTTRLDLNEDNVAGHYAQNTQPAWHDLQWNDSDSVKVPAASLPAGLKVAALPRYTIEERRFTRDSLTVGIGVPTGIYQFDISARGVGSSATSEVGIETIYAKRFN